MSEKSESKLNRRAFTKLTAGFGLGASGLLMGGCASASDVAARADSTLGTRGSEPLPSNDPPLERRVSGFTSHHWRDHFGSLSGGAILVDTYSRSLHFWPSDGAYYKIYPTSVPLTQEMTRRGRTSVVRKVIGPEWRPTPSMLQRNPDLPPYVGPGPQNPLGTHALYLGWTYYRIHGTNDTRKIGRKSSNGCIGLYNEHIAELFAVTHVGTQVKVI
jgi:L,D-transpeptidase ErfK/SrfK